MPNKTVLDTLEEITNATSSSERDYLLFKYYDLIKQELEQKELLQETMDKLQENKELFYRGYISENEFIICIQNLLDSYITKYNSKEVF